jgi:hypothetical protein
MTQSPDRILGKPGSRLIYLLKSPPPLETDSDFVAIVCQSYEPAPFTKILRSGQRRRGAQNPPSVQWGVD